MTIKAFPTLRGPDRNFRIGGIGRLVAHLIVKEISQTIMNGRAFIEFHFERHMRLASADDDRAIIGDLPKVIQLPWHDLWRETFLILKRDNRQITLSAHLTDLYRKLFVVASIRTRSIICGKRLGRFTGIASDERDFVAVILN